jgi:hypothetical protein
LEAEAKARLLEAEARTKLLETEATTKLLEAQAMLMAEETKIMLTDLETISDPVRLEWLENMHKYPGAPGLSALAMATAMARVDKSASFVNLPFFGHVVDMTSFWTIWLRWPLVGVARMTMTYVCHLFACKLFLFSSFRLCQSVQIVQR